MRAKRKVVAIAVMVLLVAGYALLAFGTDRDALWRIVSTKCVPGQMQSGNPAPCALVDQAHGYAVLKDIRGNTQYLLIPTMRVTGIEDPVLQNPHVPDYFGEAWDARHFVEERLGHPIPREDIGLAVNSRAGRTQDQLHIHIDCLQPGVRDALGAHMSDIGEDWSLLPVPLAGHTYHVRRVDQADLSDVLPFRLLPGNRKDDTLVAVGAELPGGHPGFVLLYDTADREMHDQASGADLLDHACKDAGRS